MRPDRRPVILAGNWKMNLGPQATREFLTAVREIRPHPRLRLVVAPPAVSLSAARETLGTDSPHALGAQNLHWENAGAFTGEIAGPMLRELGVTHVILGHSERRHVFGETDVMINRRLRAALEQGFAAILCIGEQSEERETRRTEAVLERQLDQGLLDIPAEMGSRLVVAYEPVWAIGTGKTATPAMAQAAHAYTRNLLANRYNASLAESIPLLYGGSIKPENIAALVSQPDVDGGLVGGASLQPESWRALVSEVSRQLDAAGP